MEGAIALARDLGDCREFVNPKRYCVCCPVGCLFNPPHTHTHHHPHTHWTPGFKKVENYLKKVNDEVSSRTYATG